MATITKRGDTYRIKVSCGYDRNNKQIIRSVTYTPKSKTPAAAKKEVQRYADEYERRVHEGKYLDGDKLTFEQVTDYWLTGKAQRDISDGGEHYLSILKAYVFPAFYNLSIGEITRLHVQKIIDKAEKDGKAPSTIHSYWVAMNAVFKYACSKALIKENPCDYCDLPKRKADTKLHYFTSAQAALFLDTALTMDYEDTYKAHTRKDDTGLSYSVPDYTEIHRIPFQFRPLYALAIYGGFRRGELAALTWRDIDFDNRKISINKAVGKRKSGEIIKEPKTEKGKRVVTLPQSCFDLLSEWKKQQRQLRLSLGTAWKGAADFEDTNIFIQADGSRIYSDTISQKFKSIVKRYNQRCESLGLLPLPDIRFHDLRHTSATLLIGNGVDIETVSYRLGHSKASVTLDIYAHPLPENDTAAADVLERALAGVG